MADWLNYLKDKFKDAAAYAMVAEQVKLLETTITSLEERIRLRDDVKALLEGKIADLESKVESLGSELGAKTNEASKLIKELEKFRSREKFDVLAGIAFKRGKKKGNYEDEPRCPQCHGYLNSHSGSWGYKCSKCAYTVRKEYENEVLVDGLMKGFTSPKELEKIPKSSPKRRRSSYIDLGL